MIKIKQRRLTETEIKLLSKPIKKSKHLLAFNRKLWQKCPFSYVIEKDNEFVGASVLSKVDNIYKIGPLIIRKKYQGQGFATRLIQAMIDDHQEEPEAKFLLGSSSPSIKAIAKKLNFHQASWSDFSFKLIYYYLSYIKSNLTFKYLWNWATGITIEKRGAYKFYIK